MKKGVIVGRRFLAFIVIFLATLPSMAHAQVVINEFMYDAPGSDTGQEWVELYNAGASAVDLTKWKISDGANHVLNVPPKNGGKGSLTLEPGAYVILADDAATFLSQYPNSQTVIDTTLALPNTSGTVSLVDGSQTPNITVDSVPYTKDLGAAGDGNSLQKNGSSWIAALPTPGAPNATTPYVPPSNDTNSNTSTNATTSAQTQTTASAAPVSSYVAPPVPMLFADAGDDRTVIVAADTEFDGRAYDRQQQPVDTVRFNWNFGDGTTAEGPAVMHHFEYPGRYAVILTIAHDMTAVSDHIIVTAEPAKLAFFANPDGSASIKNDAGRDLDLSHWIVKSFGREFILSDDSIVLAGETMRISQKTLDFWSAPQTELEYPNGVTALHAGEHADSATVSPNTNSASDAVFVSEPPVTVPAAPQAPSAPVAQKASSKNSESTAVQGNAPDAPANDTDVSTTSTTSLQVAAAGSTIAGGAYWWLGAFILAIFAAVAVFAAKRMKKGEWDIVEDTSE